MNAFKLNHDRPLLAKDFENALPYITQDEVLIFVTAAGTRGGRYEQKSYAKKIYSGEIGGDHWGAIQITTAAGVCGMLDLHAQGKLKNTGFLRQEDVKFEDFTSNRFGKFYLGGVEARALGTFS